jgi:hypothetical protein
MKRFLIVGAATFLAALATPALADRPDVQLVCTEQNSNAGGFLVEIYYSPRLLDWNGHLGSIEVAWPFVHSGNVSSFTMQPVPMEVILKLDTLGYSATGGGMVSAGNCRNVTPGHGV